MRERPGVGQLPTVAGTVTGTNHVQGRLASKACLLKTEGIAGMKEYQTYPVEICLGDQVKQYSPEFQEKDEHAFNWKRVLTMAHGKAQVHCLCPGQGEKRLSIHSRSSSDQFHLARFPDTGPEHGEDCRFFGVDRNQSGLGSYKKGVVEELDDGNIKIKLKVGLQQRQTKAPEEGESAPSNRPLTSRAGASQSSMSLLGLLHYLWTEAALNTWTPGMEGKRNLSVVHYHMMKAAAKTYAGRIRLSQNLLIGTPTDSGKQAKLNHAKSLSANQDRRRLVVVAPLAGYREGLDTANTLPISGFHGLPFLNMTPELWEITRRRYEREMAAWVGKDPVMVIAQTNPPKATSAVQADVVDLALMWMTKDWIPVESGFEVIVASELVKAQRRFEKPLRFDSQDAVFPDFWLKDRGAPVPMEVWGMATSEYQDRKQEKILHYDTTYGPGNWWSWNGAAGDELPAFPQGI